MEQAFKLDGCVNCKACEMICSYHHCGVFGYQYSSIRIQAGEDGFYASYRQPITCDTCEGEGDGEYQCLKYCFRAKDALRGFLMCQGKEAQRP